MTLLAKLGSIFGLAFFSFWASISAGVLLDVSPIVVMLTAWTSYMAGVLIVVLVGAPIRTYLLKRFGSKVTANPNSPIWRAWNRFGLLGLALLAPMTTGAQIGALIALSLGAPPRKLILAMALGAALWAAAVTLAVVLGLAAVHPK